MVVMEDEAPGAPSLDPTPHGKLQPLFRRSSLRDRPSPLHLPPSRLRTSCWSLFKLTPAGAPMCALALNQVHDSQKEASMSVSACG